MLWHISYAADNYAINLSILVVYVVELVFEHTNIEKKEKKNGKR